MRVLHVISTVDARMGGPSLALGGLAAAQMRAGMGVEVMATFRDGEDDSVESQLKAAGVSVVRAGPVGGPIWRHPDIWPRVSECVARADVVHIHALWEEVQHAAARVCQRTGKPYIIRPCGMLDPWSLRQGKWKKRICMAWRLRRNLNRAAGLHFTTAIERDLTAGLNLKAPAIVEPNGVDLAEYADLPARGEWRAKHPSLGDRPVVMFMSRLHPKKGLELLVPAFAMIAQKDAALVIAGPDSDGHGDQIRALAAKLGVADRVLFTGMLKGREKLSALVDADLFVLASHQENFGNVVAEAMAAGTAVVVSDQVNLWLEVVESGAGAVVKMDVGDIAAKIESWLGNESARRAAGANGRAFAMKHFDWDQIARRWGDRYGEL